jgi:hypothetical protein
MKEIIQFNFRNPISEKREFREICALPGEFVDMNFKTMMMVYFGWLI